VQVFVSLVNRTQVSFQVPGPSGSDCQTSNSTVGEHSSSSSSSGSPLGSDSDSVAADLTGKNCSVASTDPVKSASVSVVAVESLIDKQRAFIQSNQLQPFQVRHQHLLLKAPRYLHQKPLQMPRASLIIRVVDRSKGRANMACPAS
jgi:hypothetical protein